MTEDEYTRIENILTQAEVVFLQTKEQSAKDAELARSLDALLTLITSERIRATSRREAREKR